MLSRQTEQELGEFLKDLLEGNFWGELKHFQLEVLQNVEQQEQLEEDYNLNSQKPKMKTHKPIKNEV